MLANTTWGLSHYYLRQLYKMYILSIILYASVVWWTGKKRHIGAINKVQNQALRLICAAFRTTPIHTLEIEASVPSTNLFLNSTTKRAVIWFNKLSANNPIIQRLPNRWRANNNLPQLALLLPSIPASRRKSNTTQLLQVAKNTSPLNEQIFLFLLPPWRHTLTDFGNRLCLLNKLVKNKDKAAQLYCNQLRKLQANRSNMIVYTDGSQKHIHHHF